MKFHTKLLLAFSIVSFVSMTFTSILAERNAEQSFLNEMRAKTLSIAETAAIFIDGDMHAQAAATQDERSEVYNLLKNQLQKVVTINRRQDTVVGDIFTLLPSAQNPGVILVGVDANSDPEQHKRFGEVYRGKELEKVDLSIPQTDRDFRQDEFGAWITARAPIRDSVGKVVAALSVEIPKSRFEGKRSTLRHGLLFSFGIGLLTALIAALLLSRKVSQPLQLINTHLEGIGRGDFSSTLEFNTKDEFQTVADSINQMVQGLRERDTVKTAFSRFVSHQVLQEVIKSGEAPTIHGQRRRITVMFCDMRGFSSISEKLSPEDVVQILNEYFEAAVEAIFRYQGTLDKFIGDGVMAVFGAPLDDPFQEEHALRAALDIQAQVKTIAASLKEKHNVEVRIGIGIHSGSAIVGTMGSTKRLEYTAIGDTVNLASRLESATKDLGVDIAVSQYTYDGLRGTFQMKDLGEVNVKGKQEVVRVYSPEL